MHPLEDKIDQPGTLTSCMHFILKEYKTQTTTPSTKTSHTSTHGVICHSQLSNDTAMYNLLEAAMISCSEQSIMTALMQEPVRFCSEAQGQQQSPSWDSIRHSLAECKQKSAFLRH